MKYFFIIVALVLGLLGYFSWKAAGSAPSRATPASSDTRMSPRLRAAFLVYTNGVKRTFAAPMYHNRSQEVFIASENPEIVNVTKQNVAWGDFFNTLPMKLSGDCLTTGTGDTYCTGEDGALRFFLNDEEVPDALTHVIGDGDRLLVSFGLTTELDLAHQMQAVPQPSSLDTPTLRVEQ